MRQQGSFLTIAEEALRKYGDFISRKDILAYRNTHGVSIPTSLCHKHKGTDGMFNLRAIVTELAAAQGFVSNTATAVMGSPSFIPAQEPEKTDDDIITEINSRFCALDLMASGVVAGRYRSLIVTGNPGIGKTYNLEGILQNAADESQIIFEHVRGYVKATGLYRMLYEHRDKEHVILLDDADSIYGDEIALNILKCALDTTHKREISWRSEKVFKTDSEEEIPQSFQFDGCIIFVSNLDFVQEIRRNRRLAPHLEALMSRSFFMDLHMRSNRELMLHIRSVVAKSDILSSECLEFDEQTSILDFIDEHQRKFRELSLRTVLKVGRLWYNHRGDFDTFKVMALSTCTK